jgi:hypothetical protein
MPIYQKAWEIMQLGSKIGSAVSKDDYEAAFEEAVKGYEEQKRR